MSADSPRRLGRGLEAIISTAKQQREQGIPTPTPALSRPDGELRSIVLGDISPNRFQPRRTFSELELADLEASIRANGLLQPIIVRSRADGKWELVAGERRLRAVARLGWAEIPVLVRQFDDRAMLTLALVENLQRADLNPMEEAAGYQRLVDEFGLTQQQVADAVGKDRTTITNLLRVLTLPLAIQELVERGDISTGHARALLPIKDPARQLELANEIVARQLSVREAEARARQLTGSDGRPLDSIGARISTARQRKAEPELRRIEEQLRKRLQTDVRVLMEGKDRGVVRISFYSPDDLDRLSDLLIGAQRTDFD